MLYRLRIACALLLMVLALLPVRGMAQNLDPHQLYERSCGRCHEEHAREFVEKKLSLDDDGALVSQNGLKLEMFLKSGHGGLNTEETDIILDHLAAINRGHGLFEDKCRICHDRAYELARLKLFIQDDKLVGRYTDRDIEAFLTHHGRLTATEVPFMVETLRRQLQTTSK
ncbi:hypothetical protein [Rhodovibrio salinarum]|uniref:Cytochrome c domain-containing protein n=1 Tax=Rhodovibrio salinarum TaxID=1087 RepID=A0A934QK31_9PROT|nr:hypothetical protein [Rhodovibrio salinarum]MBK1698347.1 hypothetical protein [Rhodovibrio salinarum]